MTDTLPPPPASTQTSVPAAGPPVGRIIAVVLGALGLLIGLAATAAGGAAVWAHSTQRDTDGYFATDAERFETSTHAMTADDIDLGTDPTHEERVFDLGDLATVRLAVESVDDQSVFVGIGPTDDVERYLADVSRARIDDVDVRAVPSALRLRKGWRPGLRTGKPGLLGRPGRGHRSPGPRMGAGVR